MSFREDPLPEGGRIRWEVEAIANTEAHSSETNGVLRIALRPGGYEWRFVPAGGATFADSGSAECR